MGPTSERIQRGLDREIDAIERTCDDPHEARRQIAELEREARWDYLDSASPAERREDEGW